MIWIAAGSIGALAVVALAAMHTVAQMLRAHARERNLMLNQLLHLAGRTWQSPPSDTPVDDDLELLEQRYTQSPSQMPDFYASDTP